MKIVDVTDAAGRVALPEVLARAEHMQAIARAAGCDAFILDSGTHRQQAHKFYFCEGMVITSFNFKKSLRRVP